MKSMEIKTDCTKLFFSQYLKNCMHQVLKSLTDKCSILILLNLSIQFLWILNFNTFSPVISPSLLDVFHQNQIWKENFKETIREIC